MNKKNNWIFTVTILAFFITIIFSIMSELILSNFGLIIGVMILILFILLGVMFDMVGVAVASCTTESFHAMASNRVKNSKTAIKLVKNSAKVSSFCNDVIGDICGIMSGSAGLVIATVISVKYDIDLTFTILIFTSLIAAFTIGGKAFGKEIAIKNNENIVYKTASILNMLRNK